MKNTKDQKDLRRGGFYWVGEKPYLTVTEILGKTIPKNQLMYWFGQQIYYAMIKNPTMAEKEAMSSPYAVSDKAKSRGLTIHTMIEAWKQNKIEIEIERLPEDLKGYANGFYNFTKTNKIKILEQEKTVTCEEHQYMGTLDMIAEVNGRKILMDIKTQKDGNVYQESGLQLSAYRYALKNGIEDMAVVSLSSKGEYTFKTMYYDFDAFLHCKKLYEYLYREKLLKVGYLK